MGYEYSEMSERVAKFIDSTGRTIRVDISKPEVDEFLSYVERQNGKVRLPANVAMALYSIGGDVVYRVFALYGQRKLVIVPATKDILLKPTLDSAASNLHLFKVSTDAFYNFFTIEENPRIQHSWQPATMNQ